MFKKLIPYGADDDIAPIFAARALRGFADGFVAVLLPVYLLAMGFGGVEVGAIATATLLGSACATLAVGAWGHRWTGKALMLAAALLMAATGFGFASIQAFWPLLLVAFVGTLNPSSGDVSVFLPLEHAKLAAASDSASRTDFFARYALTGAMCSALGALASGIPDRVVAFAGLDRLSALRGMFVLYGLIGLAVWRLYGRLPSSGDSIGEKPAPLGQSRMPLLWVRTMFFKSFAAARRSPAFFDARSSTYDLRFAEKECFLVVTMPVADLMLARNIAERGVHLNFFGFIFISTSRGRARQCRVQDGRSRKSS